METKLSKIQTYLESLPPLKPSDPFDLVSNVGSRDNLANFNLRFHKTYGY